MSPCYCMCCQREGPSERKPSKKGGKERCTRQLLCPRALPRNVTQHREQLPGLRRPEGQGWHQRVHILHTLVHTPNIHEHTHILVPMWASSGRALNFFPFAFCHVCRVNRGREYMGIKGKILNLDKRGTRKPSETN